MKRYKHIFFDLDQTLWDFERCSAETLEELFHLYELERDCGFTIDTLVKRFNVINNRLWAEFSAGKITKQELRNSRFKLIFEDLKYNRVELIEVFAQDYLSICPKKPHLIPFASEVLNYLKGKYDLYIITNGFEEVQHIKMKSAGIFHYFKEIITSEKVGYRKPEKEIFTYALRQAKSAADSIMVGDNLEADILGASNSGIDNIFYNPQKTKFNLHVTYEINCLSQLKKIL